MFQAWQKGQEGSSKELLVTELVSIDAPQNRKCCSRQAYFLPTENMQVFYLWCRADKSPRAQLRIKKLTIIDCCPRFNETSQGEELQMEDTAIPRKLFKIDAR